MANFRSAWALGNSFQTNPKNHFYYDTKYEPNISGFKFGDATTDYQDAIDLLVKEQGLTPQQAQNIVDAYVTRETHNNNGIQNANLRKKAGIFENGNDWKQSQALAQRLLRNDSDAQGILYGLRYEDEKPQGNTGLKKPIPLYGDDLANITRALNPKQSRFQFDVLHRR